MGYNKENYVRIREKFAEKNLHAKEAAERRAKELHIKYPELVKIDKALSETGLAIFSESMKGKDGLDERLEVLRTENKMLQEARANYLVKIGYPADYTSVKYDCMDCQDTGFIGTKMCDCMRRELILAGYESSGIGGLIKTQSFESFCLDYYKKSEQEFSNMSMIFDNCKKYAQTFGSEKNQNLLFLGPTGLGKTHLSTSIAKAVIERGFDVIYDCAANILSDFENERFGRAYSDRNDATTDKYFDTDLLIIDDLGTEFQSQFTVSCIFTVINTRLNNNKALIISTNLNQKEIRERYGDRLASRLFGDFMAMQFYGSDIRKQKMMK